ncbi:MAG: hypothetical protein ISP01_08630 [Methanobrevibacter arboriphilus]|uniref:HNH endonuclease n=1 Tax=Methanobrevibacter arboriphilus TaxID=39441 RepID=A0A843AEG2_METAZ|nr:hypothetical protein [Methanobrevibacter arboriphilus]MBF4469452.1 hypothetical protein [Methanobrevibacter arboriphilus]
MSITSTNTDFEVDLDKTLCKKCVICSTHEYKRINRNGDLVRFIYCNANAEIVNSTDWMYQKDGYVCDVKKTGKKNVLFHTIFKKDSTNVMDHINGKRIDNRMCNFREISQRENTQNLHTERASEYPGVVYHKFSGKWTSKLYHKGKRYYNAYYTTELEAFHAYVVKCNELSIKLNKDTPAYKKYEKWLENNVLKVESCY